MNSGEAGRLLLAELEAYRAWTYERLCGLIGSPKRTTEIVGLSGTRYYVDIYAAWESRPNGEVRVFGCIDDGGWRAFFPLSEVFVRAPDGSTYAG